MRVDSVALAVHENDVLPLIPLTVSCNLRCKRPCRPALDKSVCAYEHINLLLYFNVLAVILSNITSV